MANCCEYNLCDGLATIGFMRTLIPTEMSSCISVSSGTVSPTCCDVIESEYVPKYSELSGGTFTHVRVVNSDPTYDKQGFTYALPTLVETNCCTGDTLQNKALMKSEVGFEYTAPLENIYTEINEASYCNLNCSFKEKKVWERHSYVCDENEPNNIKHSSYVIQNEIEHSSSSLTRMVDSLSETSWEISFNSINVSTKTEVLSSSSCTPSVSSGYTFGLDPYEISYSISCPTSEVPCSGGSITVTIPPTKCENEITLNITWDFDGGGSQTLSSSSSSSVSTEITIHRNNEASTSNSLSVTPTVWGNEKTQKICNFSRQTCGWSPSGESSGCSIFNTVWKWNRGSETEHPNTCS